MHSLRSDLRPLLLVRGLGGKQLAFRQYASRVRRVFLPGCSPDQVSDSIGHIMMENRSSRPLDLTRLTLESKG